MKLSKLVVLASAALAMAAGEARGQSLQDVTVGDLKVVAEKVVGLAQTVPESAYDWRPMEGTRSVADVYMHIASANYRFPRMIGVDPPDVDATWSQGNGDGIDRATAVAALNDSFSHLYAAVEGIDDLDEPMTVFGNETNVRGFLMILTTHLHEHLGQSIAYARANGVVPPWSGM